MNFEKKNYNLIGHWVNSQYFPHGNIQRLEVVTALDQSLPYSLLQPNYFRNQRTLWPCIKAAKQIKGVCIIRFRLLVLAKISNPKLWRHLWFIKMRKNKRRLFSKFLWKKPITASQKNRLLLAGCYYRANPEKFSS